jgi:hypothetical protein
MPEFPKSVASIGFDATCSLVVLGSSGKPLPAELSDHPERNINRMPTSCLPPDQRREPLAM